MTMIKNELTNSFLPALLDEILNDKQKRIFACENNILLFSLYYFAKFHSYTMPDFHKQMYEDLLYSNQTTGLLWVMFRESAKTSLAKMKVIHNICYNKRKFQIWASFDERTAKSNAYDIALELQTNERIIDDFGQLYYDAELDDTTDIKKYS